MRQSKDKWIWVGIASGLVLLLGLVSITFWGLSHNAREQAVTGEEVSASAPSSPAPVSHTSSAADLGTTRLGKTVADGHCDGPIETDRSNPEEVAYRIMEISFCFDTTLDDSTTDAMKRASSLMSESMQGYLVDTGKNALASQFLTFEPLRGYTNPIVKSIGSDAIAHDHAHGLEDSEEEQEYVTAMYVQWIWESRDDNSTVTGGSAVWNMRLVPDGAGGWMMDSYELGSFTPTF
ncbi:hypothetical protein E4U03_07580 [Rothia nasimurium]|uniref:Uncharacterized protein n=1 Tax=Rothia nasimurium TaxID=85336 RepID=A0A4Y9F5C3_9MICC|nr:hypothetical protein [Rothia nasimurium]MBF0808469.1 hypothetical protein [Rothia nasimurium]TFU21961.1 hypothetical protein E4U03_07580 [Rothia nasimurium]